MTEMLQQHFYDVQHHGELAEQHHTVPLVAEREKSLHFQLPDNLRLSPADLYLLFQRGQQLPEEAELPRVEDELDVELIGADGGVLLAQPVQLEVRHGFHVFSNQSGVGVEVARLLRTRAGEKKAGEAKGRI